MHYEIMNRTEITHYWQSLPWNEIKLKANKNLPKFVFVVLVVLLAQTFAELTWTFFTPSEESISSRTRILNHVNVAKPVSNTNLANVSSYHLFGDAKKSAPIVQQKVIDAPETRLRLDLKGVFASSDSSQALAIIASSKGQDKTYHIGDKITGGVLLHAIYEDRVILERNGQLETLRLPESKVDSQAFYSSEPLDTKENSDSDSTQESTISSGDQTQRLRNIRETLLNDPAKFWAEVRINPVMKNGEIHGYTLAHNDEKLMKALNIRQTDVITRINGQALSDPATLYSLMGDLSEQKSLSVEIERNGQQQTLQLAF